MKWIKRSSQYVSNFKQLRLWPNKKKQAQIKTELQQHLTQVLRGTGVFLYLKNDLRMCWLYWFAQKLASDQARSSYKQS